MAENKTKNKEDVKGTDEAKEKVDPNASKSPFRIVRAVADSSFMKEFREFINRGNVMELAIGVAVGGAFTAIVKSLVDDIIMPVTSLLAGGADFSTLSIDIPNIFGADTVAHIAYGNFIQNVVNFLIIAFTVFILVRALNGMHRKADKAAADEKAADEKAASDKAAEDAKSVSKKA